MRAAGDEIEAPILLMFKGKTVLQKVMDLYKNAERSKNVWILQSNVKHW
jgi:hypothetical protein